MEGEDEIDAVNVGDVLRALNLNPTLALIEKMGGTKKRGEKKMKIEEFLPIFGQVRNEIPKQTVSDIDANLYNFVFVGQEREGPGLLRGFPGVLEAVRQE